MADHEFLDARPSKIAERTEQPSRDDDDAARGLSPRVRGNLPSRAAATQAWGSIPACAGEPALLFTSTEETRVYPRVCGGTYVLTGIRTARAGLSPRVRGNLKAAKVRIARTGSIPACAGEPSAQTASVFLVRVYPRVCGGTIPQDQPLAADAGLSPRVRGNPASWAGRD
jgi:hypothetical protein